MYIVAIYTQTIASAYFCVTWKCNQCREISQTFQVQHTS